MDTLYDWLLHNTGNAGNYYTILNTQRGESGSLEVMARSSDFNIVNLFIHDTQNADLSTNQSDELSDKASKSSYIFSGEQQVIAYLTDGTIPESQDPGGSTDIRISVTEPDGEAGDITFPPTQTQGTP